MEGYLHRAKHPGRLPAFRFARENGDKARECINQTGQFTAMGMQVACISIPGYGRSSGPSRFVGPQSVVAAREALDLLAARPDVDPARLAVWGQRRGGRRAGRGDRKSTRLDSSHT